MIVHRESRSKVELGVVAPGVKALGVQEFLARQE